MPKPKPKQFVKGNKGPSSSKHGGGSAGGRNAKHGQPSAAQLESENDFLDAADEFEKSGGKWRAGDGAKSVRFFLRAVAAYDDGLRKWPESFDLAYNRATLQYQLTQDPRLLPHLKSQLNQSPRNMLERALQSHRLAVNLNKSHHNADVLFNTAQVLVSLAEQLETDAGWAEDGVEIRESATRLLREAVELFEVCLGRQEREMEAQLRTTTEAETQQRQQNQAVTQSKSRAVSHYEADAGGGASIDMEMEMEDTKSAQTELGGQSTNVNSKQGMETQTEWATVVEPVTVSTLLDTSVAQLAALTSLLRLSSSNTGSSQDILAQISAVADPILNIRIPNYLSGTPDTIQEEETTPSVAALSISAFSSKPTFTPSFQSKQAKLKPRTQRAEATAAAGLVAAVYHSERADVEFRAGIMSSNDYIHRIRHSFEAVLSTDEASQRDSDILSAYADALMIYDGTIREALYDATMNSSNAGTDMIEQMETARQLREQALTKATELFLSAVETSGKGNNGQLQSDEKIGGCFLALGNCALLQWGLVRLDPTPSPIPSSQAAVQWLNEAAKYYRCTVQHVGSDEELLTEAAVKNEVVNHLLLQSGAGSGSAGGKPGAATSHVKIPSVKGTRRNEVLTDMVEEGLVPTEALARMEM